MASKGLECCGYTYCNVTASGEVRRDTLVCMVQGEKQGPDHQPTVRPISLNGKRKSMRQGIQK